MTTKLDVLNSMIATQGELPLNEIDMRHPYFASGLRILEQKNRSVQLNVGAGFWFNTVDSYSLKADVDGKVSVPADLIQYTPIDYPDRFGTVDGYLWDYINDTDIIGETVKVKAIRCLAFEDLPVAAQDCVMYESIKTFSRDHEGDMQKLVDIKEDAQKAWVFLRAQNIREQRANTQRNPQVAAAMGRFHRSHVLPRIF